MDKKKKIKYWIDISKYDLDSADVLLNGKRYLYVGFMCHQAIEKILKCYYVYSSSDNPPYSHNLSYLSKKSGIYEKFTDEQKDFLDTLEPLNIEARYPSYRVKLLKSLDFNKAQDILERTKELYTWIKNKL